jgi:peroxiredoxin
LIATIFLLVTNSSIAQVGIGKMAPEISLPNSNDSTLNLSSFKNKVVLVEFWASWCMPCRQSIPNVIRLYKKYNSKGFEVFSISIDVNKSQWLGAVEHDKIPYTQVNDKMGWNSLVATTYNVNAIPSTFLLDKTGKIIAVNAYGSRLERKIKKLLRK